jgi:rare lipoprotein A
MRLLLPLLLGCAPKKPPEVPATVAPAVPSGPRLSGTASWYGAELAGRPTASGVPFDPDQLTAAHRTLPLGTVVVVTRVETGATVQVVVNDRGPFTGGRVLDVSQAAAARLGFIDAGTTQVTIRIVGCDPAYPSCR